MATAQGAKSEFKFEELAHLGKIGEDAKYSTTHVRVGKISADPRPRVDIRQFKITPSFQGWSKGASLTVEQYRDLKKLIPTIDAVLAQAGIEA